MNRLAVGLAKELRILPLLASLTAIILPVLLAHGKLSWDLTLFFVSLIFLLYAVHCLDTYEDYFIRKEDKFKTFTFGHGSSGYLTGGQLKAAAIFCSASFLAITGLLSITVGASFLFIALAAFLVGITYSRFLSKNILASSVAYPTGVVLAMACAYILAGVGDWGKFAALAVPVFLLLVGVKVLMDAADAKTDARTKRPNVANRYGLRTAKFCSFAFLALGLASALAFSFGLELLVVCLILAAFFPCVLFTTPKKAILLVAPGVYLFLLTQAFILAH